MNFQLKEEILNKARIRGNITFQGAEIKLFQDLSQITLQKRKSLRPLLDILRDRDIPYKWKFPFCLSAGARGHTAQLRYPEDIPAFCDALHIPHVPIPDWNLLPSQQRPRREEAMEIPHQDSPRLSRRRRSPPRRSPPPTNQRASGRSSVPPSPAHRRLRTE